MKVKAGNRAVVGVVVVAVAIVLVVVQLLATGVTGETDSIAHYQLARYAFKYPQFFLDHWGKPLYTILAAIPAQLGYAGAIAFNLACGLATGWIACQTGRKLGYRHAWAAIPFTVFMPVYLFVMYSSLTETLFSLVLVGAIYLFVSRRFIWAAVVISMIPYVRTEGVMFIVLFIPALLWMRQWRALPFLVSGFVLFGLAGLRQYGEFLWFFTKMPYSMSSAELYGKGSFWYYFGEMDYIINSPLLILILIGLVVMGLDFFRGRRDLKNIRLVTIWLLIIPGAFGFLLAQSYLWWRGLGILASLRFMACILPLGAIMALAGFDRMMMRLRAIRVLYLLFGAFILWLTVSRPFEYDILPMKPGPNNAVMQELTDWLKKSEHNGKRALYSDPLYPFYMEQDPFDSGTCLKIYTYEGVDYAGLLKPGELLVWDPQFAGYEGRLSLDSLLNNKHMRLLKIFYPDKPFTVIGGKDYRLALFMKAPRVANPLVFQEFFSHDFENRLNDDQLAHRSADYFTSPGHSMVLSRGNEFSPALEDRLVNLPDTGDLLLRASVQILSQRPIEPGKTLLVISIEDKGNRVLEYHAVKDSSSLDQTGKWNEISLVRPINRHLTPGGFYKVYVWYTGKDTVYIDDLTLEYKHP